MDRLIKDKQHQLDRLKAKKKVLVKHKGDVKLSLAYTVTEKTPKFPVRDDSELSYEHITTRRDLELSLLFLHKNYWWSLMVASSAFATYFAMSFIIMFTPDDTQTYEFMFCHVVGYIVLIIDSAISILIRGMKTTSASGRELNKQSLVITLVNLFFLITPEAMLLGNEILQMISIILACFRAGMKIYYFFFTDFFVGIMHNTFASILKHFLASTATFHTFVIMWKASCLHCKHYSEYKWLYRRLPNIIKYNLNWVLDNKPIKVIPVAAIKAYILSCYYIIGAMGNIGFEGASFKEDLEQTILIAASLIGAFIMKGIIMNVVASILFDSYRVYYKHLLRLKLIKRMMINNKIPQHILNEVASFEEKYLKNKLIELEPMLYKELPAPLKVEICLDKYWYALQKSFFFENASTDLKQEVVMIMKTAIYNKGESIYERGHPMHMMAFIARGSVNVLTVEDTETPLFTLGIGSCIGALNLVYTRSAKFEIKAASFCMLHTLSKADFWRYFRKKCLTLGTKHVFLNIANKKIQEAKDSCNLDKTHRITLMEAKKKLPIEENIWEYNVAGLNKSPYIKSKFCDFQMHDKIFIRTVWPWIFYPHTDLLRYWNYFQATLVVLVATIYPYYICYMPAYVSPDLFIMLQMTVSLFYFLDIFVQILTAVEYNEEMVTTVEGILRVRLNSFKFICESIGAIPTEIVYYLFMRDVESSNYIRLFKLTKLLKLLKVPNYLSTFEKSCFGVNLLIMRLCKYMVYIVYVVYLLGGFWHRYYCKEVFGCERDSYIKSNLTAFLEKYTFYRLMTCVLWVICPFTRSGQTCVATVADLYIIIGLCFLGSFFFIYLSSDLWATKSVTNLSRDEYCAMTEGLITEMRSYNMDRTTISRIEEYLMLQWVEYEGIQEDDLVNDLPTFIRHDMMNARFLEYLQEVPFFRDLDTDILQKLAQRIHTHFLPPMELVIYEGQMVKDFFIVEKGFVEVVCSNSKSIVKILGPKDSFCLIEMLLKKPSCFTYRTSTHVSIIKLSRIQILIEVFSQNQLLAYTVDKCISEMEQSIGAHRLFRHKEIVLNVCSEEYEEEKSFFTFSTQKRDPLCMDYDQQIRSSRVAKRLCKLMMRSTILPSGKFILYYERFHAIMVLTMCMYVPLMHFYSIYWMGFFYISIIFDFLQLFDMYVRLHICYYNKIGILVSHPKSTAIHYLKTSFVVDFVAFVPFEKILHLDRLYVSKIHVLGMGSLLCYNRLLAMYRYRFLFYQKSKVVKTTFLKLLLIHLPILCLIINVLVTFYMFCMTTVVVNHGSFTNIILSNNSWIKTQEFRKQVAKVPTVYEIHVDATYLVMMMFYNCKFINFIDTLPSLGDTVILCVLLLLGYFYFALLTAKILLVKAKVDSTLMLNQSYASDIKHKLAKMNLKGLHNEILKYFTCTWKHSQSINSRQTVAMLHEALQEDYLIRFHVGVLQKVPIFDDDAPQVSRILGRHFTNVYFPDNSIIINLNDIIDFVYIIRKGEVKVSNAGNKYQTTLLTGSLFGNIDSVRYTRNMVKYECIEPVELWCIKTELMYKLIKEIPFITTRLNKHICLKCLSYVKNRAIIEKSSKKAVRDKELLIVSLTKWTRVSKILASHILEWMFIILSYISANWTIYTVAFREDNLFYERYLAIYCFFDAFCILQILHNFYIPYFYHNRNISEKREAIRSYLKTSFPLLVISLIPFELVILALPRRYHHLQDFARLNRLFRLLSCYLFFKHKYNSINVNVILMDCLAMFAQITLFVHGWACIVFYISCPNHKCFKDSWVYKPVIVGPNQTRHLENICDKYYVCSLYYSSAILAKSPFYELRPNALIDRLVFVFMIFCGTILHNVVVAQIFVMTKHAIYSRFDYVYKTNVLKNYLSYSMLSPRLLNKVYKYVFSLWVYCKGQQMPEFIELLPTHLKTSFKMRLYGHHIYQSPLFELCHPDFTRQIIEKLQVQVYFDGNTICRQGEINETLYFIHKGDIEVCEINDTEIIVVDELWEGDTFGVVQGLFNCIPHKFTFMATSATVLVTLTKSDWDYLLPFFPASDFFIYGNFTLTNISEDIQKEDSIVSSEDEEDKSSDEED